MGEWECEARELQDRTVADVIVRGSESKRMIIGPSKQGSGVARTSGATGQATYDDGIRPFFGGGGERQAWFGWRR